MFLLCVVHGFSFCVALSFMCLIIFVMYWTWYVQNCINNLWPKIMYLPPERIYVSFSQVPGTLALLGHLHINTRIMKIWGQANISVRTCLLPFYLDPGVTPQTGGGSSVPRFTWQNLAFIPWPQVLGSSIVEPFSCLAVPSEICKHKKGKSSPKHGAHLHGPPSTFDPGTSSLACSFPGTSRQMIFYFVSFIIYSTVEELVQII